MHLLIITTAVLLSHAALIAAGWGYISSWLAPILKQDKFSKTVNTVIADLLIVITALVVAILHVPPGATLTWAQLTSTLWYAALAAAGNFLFFLKPTGLDDTIQTKTSIPAKSKVVIAAPPSGPGAPGGV